MLLSALYLHTLREEGVMSLDEVALREWVHRVVHGMADGYPF